MTQDKQAAAAKAKEEGQAQASAAPPSYRESMEGGDGSRPAEAPRPAIRVEGEGTAGLADRDDMPGAARPPDTPSSALSTSSRYASYPGVRGQRLMPVRYTEGGIYDTQSDGTLTEDGVPQLTTSTPGLVEMNQEGLGQTRASVASDGRVNINIDQRSTRLSRLLVPALRHQLEVQQHEQPTGLPPTYVPPSLGGVPGEIPPPPPMNVVIHVVGSRGDVQPFVALGKVLKETYGHRVRLATHATFRGFVEENGLEFFAIGGDPAELMAFMVRNPGLMPGSDAIKSGDIGRRRKGMWDIVRGCWRSCYEAGDGLGPEVSDRSQNAEDRFLDASPFVADAIVANPPSFAHIHCAEKLGVPLHLMFTMPWSPTQAFPHPLANIQSSNADANMTNFLTYALVEMMTWQGLGDIINRLRERKLGLEPLPMMTAPGMAARLKVPYTYCWSPALIPKPKDWGGHISIAGFYFLSLAGNYTPEPDLAAFLEAGPPPVYIGFGSIVVDDPTAMTKLIFEAVRKTGQRALVSKGWGGFGADELGVPEGVFMLGNVPHDWLFRHVSCVVHHGGAGTTAAGIALQRPTVVVPFFGDQPFWGAMVEKAGAGPAPIPHKELTADNLAAAITHALEPQTVERAKELGAKISREKGADVGGKCFHDALAVDAMRCSLAPARVAVWRVKKTDVRLSAFAAAVLAKEGLLKFDEVKLFRAQEHFSGDGPLEPITGAASALLGTITSMGMGFVDIPVQSWKVLSRAGSSSAESLRRRSSQGRASSPGGTTTTTASSAEAGSSVRTASPGASTLPTEQSSLADAGPTDGERPASSHSPSLLSPTDTGLSKPSTADAASTASADGPPPATHPDPASLARSRSRSRSKSRVGADVATALGMGRGLGRVVEAGFKSPLDFTLALAQGFHNAPRLYGDATVRAPARVTGFHSGARAAAKEFGFGMYDGISGLVTQPLEGAKKGGLAGLIKGFGKGIGGVALKPAAGIWGIPGYTFKGIYKELQKATGSSVQSYIIAARTAQGLADARAPGSEAEQRDVLQRWQLAQPDIQKQRKAWIRRGKSPASEARRSRSPVAAGLVAAGGALAEVPSPSGTSPSRTASMSIGGGGGDGASGPAGAAPQQQQSLDDADPEAFERAIRESVRQTSTGDPAQDALIERALRASVQELQRAQRAQREERDRQDQQQAGRQQPQQATGSGAGGDGTRDEATEKRGAESDAVRRAVEASIAEADRARREQRGRSDEKPAAGSGSASDEKAALKAKDAAAATDNKDKHEDEDDEYRRQLEAAIQASLQERGRGRRGAGSGDYDSSDGGTDEDEGYQRAVRESIEAAKADGAIAQHPDEKKKAGAGEKSEEEIVMEYIKRQSLLEEEHRQARGASKDAAP